MLPTVATWAASGWGRIAIRARKQATVAERQLM
jgi:hypothetical protein